ncbi:MAG: guanylate kinase [Elusimicrobia bacterium]|nr:guanylate kinase [Elusimicrobiota bacterium]
MRKRGFLVILSAPSGAGKSTICRKLLRLQKNLKYSVSATTRPARPGEKEGKHYHFVSPAEFKKRIRQRYFLEWARVHDRYYGTPRKFVEQWTRKGYNVLLAIDVKGALNIRKKYPDCILIFVLPPALRSLKERLLKRKDDRDSVHKRLLAARKEMKAIPRYDYAVVNDDLRRAINQIQAILTTESLKTHRGNYV